MHACCRKKRSKKDEQAAAAGMVSFIRPFLFFFSRTAAAASQKDGRGALSEQKGKRNKIEITVVVCVCVCVCVCVRASDRLCRLHHPDSVSSFAPFYFTVLHCLLVGCLVGGDGGFGEHQARYQGGLTTNQASPDQPTETRLQCIRGTSSLCARPASPGSCWLVSWMDRMGWTGKRRYRLPTPHCRPTNAPTHSHTHTHACFSTVHTHTQAV
ncbi:hypothetical protein B0T26DRAFT_427671 [Lasiosphaeria miniovina]|uniref:Uncharacterized protein n=1 Tax=Lasiosphaeria miniovina TaxID=1954250 RepID=A0AA40A5S5_9PEZI|nr:uncharacterized protein B0T26DRAFT_427671 [Lasiosphaeria miniovina]KAK0709871.1 hypothetical protein B0T26DRAFT_427671 [Lasiosphaeria miniovina]